ncbi:MAG: enoyl-CoA hydratase [Thermoproteota archaeon]|jgi:short chain enoyl-CoA hydratase (EC 4.2.1.17)
MSYQYQNIILEIKESIGIIYLNRPKVLNALNKQTVDEIIDAMKKLNEDDKIKAIILTGNGDNFSAGADIKEMIQLSPLEAETRSPLANWDIAISSVKKPVIAAIKGYTLGGGLELALSCDLIIASEETKIGQPEINIGLMPGGGGTQRLARLIGKHKAMELILTGKMIDAKEAERIGIINKVVPKEKLIEEAMNIAKEISAKAPLAVKYAKESILYAFESNLNEGLKYERKLFYLLLGSEDGKEGMKAFIEKRAPQYKGR